jgi:hypothetical protein
MGKIIAAIVAVALLAGVGAWYITSSKTPSASQTASAATTTAPVAPVQGAIVIGITDATGAIQSVSEVSMGISKVEIYSATQGWIALPANANSYDLLSLKAKNETRVFAAAPVTPDTYSKVRVSLGDITVATKAGAKKKATAITSTIDLEAGVKINANEVTAVTLDFLADKSLHTTAKSEYVFVPVLQVTSTSNAIGGVDAQGLVTVTGGNKDFDATMGTDIDGSVKANFELDQAAKLDVDASGAVSIIGGIKPTGGLKPIDATTTGAGTAGGVINL